MDVQQIKGLSRDLKKFLDEFGDCFGRSEPREHLRTYVQGRLSDLPQAWAEDPVRRREVGIPEEVVFRTKPAIALEQIGRTVRNGIRVAAWTFDELYGRGREFLDGLRGPAHTVVVARNVLNPQEIKYFLSNLLIDGQTVTLEWLLWVAFSRWPIERCFEMAKSELGMDHFEMRSWRGIHRHWYLTQVSRLFCARVRQQRREKKRSSEPVPDGRTGSHGGLRVGASAGVSVVRSGRPVRTDSQAYPLLSAEEPMGSHLALEENPAKAHNSWDRCLQTEVLYTGCPMKKLRCGSKHAPAVG